MNEQEKLREPTLSQSERIVVGIFSIISGIILIYLALAGPLWLEIIDYKTSASAITQTEAQDLANLLFLAPLCIAAGIALVLNKSCAKYFLIMVPIYLIYVPLSYGIGMEWSSSNYTGNSETYFFLFLFLVVTGILALMSGLALFNEVDAPDFNSRNLKIYVSILYIFLLMMAFMWIGEVLEVIKTGDTASGSYSEAPTVFWVIRFFDLGFSIPLGLIAGYLLLTRPKKAYPLVLLFFGFFLTMSVAVNLMGWMMYLRDDPNLQIEGLFVFGSLGILSILGYYYLIKDKISMESIKKHSGIPN